MRRESAVQVVRRLIEHVEKDGTDYAPELMRMPVGRYFDEDVAAAERERVFTRMPFIAAHSSELVEPGDFVTKEHIGVPMLLVRQDDGTVRAFTNVCRHRGARLELEAHGNRKRFSCRYHRWCYRRDGGLQSLPFPEGFEELNRDAHGLVALPTDERHGFVWVLLTPGEAMDMGGYLGADLDADIAASGIGAAVVYRERVFDLPMNWKFVMDGFLDTYHLQFLHPKTVGPFFLTNVHTYDSWGRNSRLVVARRSIEGLKDADLESANVYDHVIGNFTIYPATVMATQPDHFEAWTVLPHPTRADSCRATLRFLVDKLPETDPEKRFRQRNWDVLLSAVLNEDWAVAQSIADSLPGGHVPETVYGRNEIAAQTFYRQVQADLGTDGDTGGPGLDR
jgi:phenylpropionate dioxygenase-like ring-hydroxylating dioxygenase large terminal subunit